MYPGRILLVIAFLLSVYAYGPWHDMYTTEGYYTHSICMAISYCIFFLAANRMTADPTNRFMLNTLNSFCVFNVLDEIREVNTFTIPWEYIGAGIALLISITIFLYKRKRNGSGVSRSRHGTSSI